MRACMHGPRIRSSTTRRSRSPRAQAVGAPIECTAAQLEYTPTALARNPTVDGARDIAETAAIAQVCPPPVRVPLWIRPTVPLHVGWGSDEEASD